jgi:hypothetical protein
MERSYSSPAPNHTSMDPRPVRIKRMDSSYASAGKAWRSSRCDEARQLFGLSQGVFAARVLRTQMRLKTITLFSQAGHVVGDSCERPRDAIRGLSPIRAQSAGFATGDASRCETNHSQDIVNFHLLMPKNRAKSARQIGRFSKTATKL